MPADPWTARVWREHRAGNVTRAGRDVLLTLRTYRGRGGEAYPSHATLAERVGCCSRTVARALAMARDLGLVDWTERRVKAAWRWLRSSNLYRLRMPPEPVQPGRRVQPESTNGQKFGGGEISERSPAEQGRKAALATMLATAMGLPDLLRARREAVLERLGAG